MTKENNYIREKILKGLELAHKRLIKIKKERDLEIAISDNGKVVRLKARNII